VVQDQITYFHPATMAQADKMLTKVTGGSDVFTTAKPNKSWRGHQFSSEAERVAHADRLMAELTDLFNRFPGLKRNATGKYVLVQTPRAQCFPGGGGMTWGGHAWAQNAGLTEAEALKYYAEGRWGEMFSYFPGFEVSGTIRHEYCHSLQTYSVLRKWQEVTEQAMGKIKFRKWYKANVSRYLGDNQARDWSYESLSECFVRYTEPAHPGFKGYKRGTFPQPIEDFLDQLTEGRI